MVETRAVGLILHRLKECSWITITGGSGEGKTTLGLLVLRKMKENGYHVYEFQSEDYREFQNVINKKISRTILMLSDVCGSGDFDPHAFEKWKGAFNKLLRLPAHRGTASEESPFVIFICQSQILESVSGGLGRFRNVAFRGDSLVDITNSTVLSAEEKKSILSFHLSDNSIDLHEHIKQKICSMSVPHGFPHLCKMYATDIKRDPLTFFASPLHFLKEETKKYMHIVEVKFLFKELIKNSGHLEIVSYPEERRGELNSAVEKMSGSNYLYNKHNTIVKFSHQSYYESVLYTMGGVDKAFLIQHCELSYLLNRVKLAKRNTTENKDDRNTVVDWNMPSVKKLFLDRFLTEIKNKNFYILNFPLCQNPDFCHELIKLFAKGESRQNYADEARTSISEQVGKHVNDAVDNDRRNLLSHAISARNVGAIDALLTYGADVNMFVNGRNALHASCRIGFVEGVRKIICQIKDVNEKDAAEETALFYACNAEEGVSDLIQILLSNKFDVDNQEDVLSSVKVLYDKDLKSEIRAVADCVQNEEFKKLLEEYMSDSPCVVLHKHCRQGDMIAVSNCLSSDVNKESPLDVNEDIGGTTAIHEAANSESVTGEIIQILVDKGADVNKPDKKKFTALHYLCLRQCIEGLRFILPLIKDINAQSGWYGFNALHFAAVFEKAPCCGTIIQSLLDAGADINTQNDLKISPLHYVAANGNRNGVEILLKRGLSANSEVGKDTDDAFRLGQTPLHWACLKECCNQSVVKLLLEYGANVNAKDVRSRTPLYYICNEALNVHFFTSGTSSKMTDSENLDPEDIRSTRYSIAKLLIERDAEMDTKDDEGTEALHGLFLKLFEEE